jgi:hypothetical protein
MGRVRQGQPRAAAVRALLNGCFPGFLWLRRQPASAMLMGMCQVIAIGTRPPRWVSAGWRDGRLGKEDLSRSPLGVCLWVESNKLKKII